jgi:Na+-transporting NADH:ubiquinone oxidoreductase subunit F
VLLTLAIREVLPATPRARIVRIELGGAPFDYAAGQAILVGVRGGPKRPYSVAASPEEARREGYLELLVGVDANGTPGPHLPLERGRVLDVNGPLGTFTFPAAPAERQFVFIAGGTGIAPLRAMLHHALAIPHNKIGLLYSARTPDEFAYENELRALARDGRIELRQTVTRTVGEVWSGQRGRIGRAELLPLVHNPATLCFICGPPALVAEMSALLAELGIERSRIRVEEWG